MALFLAWLAFAIESVVAIVFGVIFWKAWSRSAMSSTAVRTAIVVYGLCAALCLGLMFFVPL